MGGRTEGALRFPRLTVIGIDRDPQAIDWPRPASSASGIASRAVHTTYDCIDGPVASSVAWGAGGW